MAALLIVSLISFGSLASMILIKRRYNAVAAIIGGLSVGICLWAIASAGALFWFANSP